MNVTIEGRAIAPPIAPIWRRLVALAIDSIVSFILTGIPAALSEVVLQATSEETRTVVFTLIVYLVFVLYQGLAPAISGGQTAGMYLLKVRTVDARTFAAPSPERCMVRGFALISSLAVALVLQRFGPFYITGPLMMAALLLPALMRPDRRALHDLAAGTVVVAQPV